MESKLSQRFVFGRGVRWLFQGCWPVIVHQPSHHSAPAAPEGGVEDSILDPLIVMMAAWYGVPITHYHLVTQSPDTVRFHVLIIPPFPQGALKHLIPGVPIDFDSLRQNMAYVPKQWASISDIAIQDSMYGIKHTMLNWSISLHVSLCRDIIQHIVRSCLFPTFVPEATMMPAGMSFNNKP
jgi:hypothetical protein